MAQIEDGTGTGSKTKVDGDNRLHTLSVTKSENHLATEEGRAYNINTGEITLTSANESAILYFKYTGTKEYVINSIAVGLGPSTGGSSASIPVIKVTRNPTAGTIVSSPTNVDISSNRNFNSANTVSGVAYKGAEGNTMTGDSDHLLLYQSSGGRLFASIEEVLRTGNSIGIKIFFICSTVLV